MGEGFSGKGNRLPRKTFKIQEFGGYFRLTIPPEAADHLEAEGGTVVKLSYWRRGDRVRLDEDAIIVEVVRGKA